MTPNSPTPDADMVAFTRAVGATLRAARKAKGLWLVELAPMVGLSLAQMSRIETGGHALHMQRLYVVCEALGVSPVRVIARAQREAFPLGHPAWDTPDGAVPPGQGVSRG